ncbi:MAG: amino acid adenylation domain-containing protein [Dehalococcoidia bacterium]
MIALVQEWFSRAAERYPDKPGVWCQDDVLSYGEVDAFTNALAREIRGRGVPRGSFVPFFMDKSVGSIQSILGILKADCAYVPLDAASPGQRLEAILAATKAPLVIVDGSSRERFEELVPADRCPPLLDLDSFEPKDTRPRLYENLSIDIAYVLFTSGSTGTPKGVMIPHKAIIDYIDWCVDEYGLTAEDVISNHAPLYFDNSTFDLYTAFHTGATLHLVHEELNAVIPFLVSWIRERRITTFFCVPSVLRMLLRSRRLKADSFPELRHVIAAGEVLPPDVVAAWMELYPHIQFTNMYGPTEITVDCTFHVMDGLPDPARPIPIGRARRNMELFVRMEDGSLSQSAGAEGELLVRGTSVAYGYLGNEGKTAEAFIQNPANDTFHDPLYCTGDLVRLEEAGVFQFLGRADHQVKLLGYRIELGEVETALNGLEEVAEGVVVFRDEEPKEIGALVVLAEGVQEAAVLAGLRQRLPAYMVPTTVKRYVGNLPQTPNGKYDRKAATQIVFEPDQRRP